MGAPPPALRQDPCSRPAQPRVLRLHRHPLGHPAPMGAPDTRGSSAQGWVFALVLPAPLACSLLWGSVPGRSRRAAHVLHIPAQLLPETCCFWSWQGDGGTVCPPKGCWWLHRSFGWVGGWVGGCMGGHPAHLPPPWHSTGTQLAPLGAVWLPAAALPTRQAPLAAGAAGRVLRRRIRFGAGRAGRDALKSHEYESAAPGGRGRSNLSLVTVTGVTNTPTPGQRAGGGRGTGLSR